MLCENALYRTIYNDCMVKKNSEVVHLLQMTYL